MTAVATDQIFLNALPPGCTLHFAGVGGSAMNGLALLLAGRGFRVVGTDPSASAEIISKLGAAGIPVYKAQDGRHIPPETQLVVASAALRDDHPELVAARSRNISIVKYARMLGMVMEGSDGIAVSGTHGKTTTSAMIVAALDGAGIFPEFIIGGVSPSAQISTARSGNVFVAEACEYDRSFLNLRPRVAIITNIEADHLDVYRDLDDIVETFGRFAGNLRSDGTLIYCLDSATASAVAGAFSCRTVSYGLDTRAQVHPADIRMEDGRTVFDVVEQGEIRARVSILPPGLHNVSNALAAFAAGRALGAAPQALADGLGGFRGVGRRFEWYGTFRGIDIVDDYAHHPTEIRALLGGVSQRFPGRRVVVLFQPHQISRTAHLFEEFSRAFGGADRVYLADIYAARDHGARGDVTSETLAARIREHGISASHCPDFNAIPQWLLSEVLCDGDVFLTVGAGNIHEIAGKLRDLLQK